MRACCTAFNKLHRSTLHFHYIVQVSITALRNSQTKTPTRLSVYKYSTNCIVSSTDATTHLWLLHQMPLPNIFVALCFRFFDHFVFIAFRCLNFVTRMLLFQRLRHLTCTWIWSDCCWFSRTRSAGFRQVGQMLRHLLFGDRVCFVFGENDHLCIFAFWFVKFVKRMWMLWQ